MLPLFGKEGDVSQFRMSSIAVLLLAVTTVGAAAPPGDATPAVIESLEIAKVWSGHPVGFFLLTQADRQYVAFYDAERQMTVAARKTDAAEWQFVRLPSQVVWDSHNYITMTVDDEGFLHLAGNMHGVPLIYFRTDKPHDITTFRRIEKMVGREESRVTYPKFFRGPKRELIFTYRDGGSGRGNQIYNRYHPASRAWVRLLDTPLLDGEGEMSAYPDAMQQDKQGVFHFCWVWRDTPDCATNHDVCYARSRDLVHWEKSDGAALKLPITYATNEIVDPIRPGQGLINGNARLGFDDHDRPVVSYIKYDANGRTQAYNARVENGRWVSRQASNWDYRWEFSGGGSIGFEISIGAVERDAAGRLVQTYRHPKAGSGRWLLDPETLTPKSTLPAERRTPPAAGKPEIDLAGIHVRWAGDSGESPKDGIYYMLRWETLGPNRDRPREGPLPPASTLRLFKLKAPADG